MRGTYFFVIVIFFLSAKVSAQIIADGLPGCLDPTLMKEGTLFCGGGANSVFDIVGTQFVVRNVDGIICCPNATLGGDNESYFQFGPIDISQFSNVSIACDYAASATGYEDDFPGAPHFGCTGTVSDNGHDQIVFTYILDGTPITDLYVHGTTQADFTGNWNTGNVINGTSLIIKVFAANKATDEIFYFSNLLVEGTPDLSAGPDLTACSGGAVTLQGTGIGTWSGGLGTFSNTSDPTSTYTLDPSETGTVTLTYASDPVLPGCPPVSDEMDIDVTAISADLSGGDVLCPDECADVNVLFTGGIPPYTIDLEFSSPAIGPFAFPFSIPGFNVGEVITVCYGTTIGFDLSTNTLTLPSAISGNSGSLSLVSLSDSGGCNDVPQNSTVSFTFNPKPTGTPATMLECGDQFDQGIFDFSSLEAAILNGNTGIVTFYSDMALTNMITPPYIGGSTTIYARIENSFGCFSDPIPIMLIVELSGDAGFVTFTCSGGNKTCNICDGDGQLGEDVDLFFTFDNASINYTIELIYFVNGVQSSYTDILPGTGGFFTFNIDNDAIFSIVSIQADGECVDVTGLPTNVSINYTLQPSINPLNAIIDCNPINLPPITGQNLTGNAFYNTAPDGSGTSYAPGDIISSSISLFAINGELFDCYDNFQLDIEIGASTTLIAPPSDTICGFYIFPAIPGHGPSTSIRYYSNPGGTGMSYAPGDTLMVTDTTIYLFNPTASCPSNEPFFSIVLGGNVVYDSVGVLTACDSLILPNISGSGFTDSVRYFTQPNGLGDQYLIGDTLYTSDTLYIYDTNTLCLQDTTPVIIEINPGVFYYPQENISNCEFYILPNIEGINVTPNAMYFTAPNGGGVGLNPGDSIKFNSTLYIFDTTTICNINQPFFTVQLFNKIKYDLPFIVNACGSFALPPITGTSLPGTDGYYSGSLGTGSPIPVGTVFTSDTTIYIFSGPTTCSLDKQIKIIFSQLESGIPDNFSICSSEGAINLFDHLGPPYTPGGEWVEQTTSLFDLSDPMNVPMPQGLQTGNYRFRYVVSSAECGTVGSILSINIIESPTISNDTTVNICLGQNSLDLSQYITTTGQVSSYNYLNTNGSVTFNGAIADISNLIAGGHIFKVFTSNLDPSLNITCSDSARLSLMIFENPSAGDDIQGDYCIGGIVDVSSLLSNNDDVGRYSYTNNPSLLIDSLFNTASLTPGPYDILHILDGALNCNADTAIITINLVNSLDAGLDANVSVCGVGSYNLTNYLNVNDKSGSFEVSSGTFTLNGNMVTATTPGAASFYYILGDGVVCKKDTSLINFTVLEVKSGTFTTQTCNATYTYEGTVFTPTNNVQTINLLTAMGCDSLVQVMIDFTNAKTSTITETICAGDSIQINGNFYSQNNLSGLDTLFGMSSEGCDSILTIQVTLEQPSFSSINITTCDENYALMVGADTYNFINNSGQTILPGMSSNGCDSIVNVTLNIEPFDYTYSIIQPECIEDMGILEISSFTGSDSLNVTGIGISGSFSQSDLPIIFTTPVASYNLTISNTDGSCSGGAAFDIIEAIEPNVTINATAISDSTWQLALDSDVNITTYFWTTIGGSLSCWDCAEPILTGNGEVLVLFDYGLTCVGSTSTTLIMERDNTFNVPNIISVNGDGINDNFTLHLSENHDIKISTFALFDRWGNLMASIEDRIPVNGEVLWNGRFNNEPVNPGVYVYILNLNVGGKSTVLKGDITVIR